MALPSMKHSKTILLLNWQGFRPLSKALWYHLNRPFKLLCGSKCKVFDCPLRKGTSWMPAETCMPISPRGLVHTDHFHLNWPVSCLAPFPEVSAFQAWHQSWLYWERWHLPDGVGGNSLTYHMLGIISDCLEPKLTPSHAKKQAFPRICQRKRKVHFCPA